MSQRSFVHRLVLKTRRNPVERSFVSQLTKSVPAYKMCTGGVLGADLVKMSQLTRSALEEFCGNHV